MLDRPARRSPGSRSALATVLAYSSFPSGHVAKAYNEAAFRYFLAVDWRRAKRSTRSLLLVLVTARPQPGGGAKLPDATAAAIFSVLARCLREVDFIGWYRDGYVAAAVLPQGPNKSEDVRQRTADRLVKVLRERLSPDWSERLRVRVIRLGGDDSL